MSNLNTNTTPVQFGGQIPLLFRWYFRPYTTVFEIFRSVFRAFLLVFQRCQVYVNDQEDQQNWLSRKKIFWFWNTITVVFEIQIPPSVVFEIQIPVFRALLLVFQRRQAHTALLLGTLMTRSFDMLYLCQLWGHISPFTLIKIQEKAQSLSFCSKYVLGSTRF